MNAWDYSPSSKEDAAIRLEMLCEKTPDGFFTVFFHDYEKGETFFVWVAYLRVRPALNWVLKVVRQCRLTIRLASTSELEAWAKDNPASLNLLPSPLQGRLVEQASR